MKQVKNVVSSEYKNSKQAYEIFQKILAHEEDVLRDKEHFWVMGIDHEGYIVCIYIVALGQVNKVQMTAAEMLDIAIGLKGKKIVLAHNHPSGNTEPSEQDIEMTNILYHVCVPFGIEILDHLIITENGYYSFEEELIMKQIKDDNTHKGYVEGFDEGREAGKEQGLEKGIKQGLKQGIEKGIEQNKIEVARTMLSENINPEIISKVLGFSIEEIKLITRK